MARIVIDSEGGKIYEILEDRFTVGAGPANNIRLRDDSLDRVHLEFVRRGVAYRVHPAAADIEVLVNGEPGGERTLCHGDRIEVGDSVLTFENEDFDEEDTATKNFATLAAEVSTALGVEAPTRSSSRTPRPRRGPPLPIVLSIISAVAILIFALIRAAPSYFGSSASTLLALAENQLEQGNLELAQSTLDSARQRPTDATTRTKIETLGETLRERMQRRSDAASLSAARTALANLHEFERAYLRSEPDQREPAREIVRKANRWIIEFNEVCQRYDTERGHCAEVEEIVARYTAAAQLEQPDTLDDVVFAARYLVQLKRRRYREAVSRLEVFAAAATPTEAAAARQLQAKLRDEGSRWVRGALRKVRALIARGFLDDARWELQFLELEGLPEWSGAIEAAAAELARAEAG